MEMEWESCGWWKWRRAAQRRASGSDPTPSDTLRRPDPLSSLRNRPPIVWFETVTFSHVNMQRFRPSVPKFGENKWKKNGREPMKLDKIYAPFRETYPMQIRNWVLGAGKNVKRKYYSFMFDLTHTLVHIFAESPCIPDMMTLFECLQKNEFHQANCDKPLAVFQSCYSAHLVREY